MKTLINRLFILSSLLMIFLSCTGRSEQTAMQKLEEAIRDKNCYEREFEQRTDVLRKQLSLCSDNGDKWETAARLHKEYLSYDIDSALVYSNLMQAVADTPERETIAQQAYISCLCALRQYQSVKYILEETDTAGFSDIRKYAYYKSHITLYTSLGNEVNTDDDIREENIRERYRYQKLLAELPCISDRERKYINGKQLMIEERYDEALDSLYAVLEMENDISSTLHTTYAIANCYHAKGDRSNYKKYLAETAVYDLKRPNRQYRSLYDLALCLYEDGDYSKAGDFIHITVMDAISCKHDTRIINAASAQTIISAATEENARDKKKLWAFFCCIMMLTIVMISATLAKVNRQRKRLKHLMLKTKELNKELSSKNAIISEANLIKEKYMFKYMYLSANFIKEMDVYRKELRHTYKENGEEALLAKLREPEYIYMQYKSFYRLFDEIFLGIFPEFPDKVNSLLKEGRQIVMKHKGTMPTEMRILAVIRLGITESRKIAEFLNTSVNTIYTYRTKMRYDSIDGPEQFEEKIKHLDYFKI